MKKICLVLLLSSLVLGSIDIFGGSSEADEEVELPQGCAWATDGRCIRCLSTYELDGAECKKKEDEIPCNGKIPCDDAELVVKKTPKVVDIPTPAPSFKIIIPEQNNKNLPNTFQNEVPFSGDVPADQNEGEEQGQEQEQEEEREFSLTNTQEENVDEADLLKTDGTYFYTISRQTFSITRVYPVSDIQVLHSLTYPKSFHPQSLLLEGDYVAVIGFSYKNKQTNTRIYIYNVKNRGNPSLIRTFEMEGSYFQGRKASGFVYVVSQIREAEERYAWLKVNNVKKDISTLTQTKNCIKNETLYYVNILGFNLTNPSEYRAISVRTIQINVLYMSESNIFLASNRYEKRGSISHSIVFLQKVFVRKTIISHHACQKILGKILNQFSMDEYEADQVLRVATTYYRTNQRDAIDSRVYCLNRNLKVISSRTGIAPKEQIYSARYVGHRLYLVTFRRVDPFFVIEFDTHHLEPKILGEVKITGYSSYLHIYDETTIIGIGYEVTENAHGRLVRNGIKFSVFNVTDPANPIVAATDHLSDKRIYSMAIQEHKAFFFSKKHDLMIIPAFLRDNSNPFSGVIVFKVTASSIEFKTLIDHIVSTANDNIYQRQVQRTFYVEDMLYTKSLCLLKVNKLSDFINQKTQPIPCD